MATKKAAKKAAPKKAATKAATKKAPKFAGTTPVQDLMQGISPGSRKTGK